MFKSSFAALTAALLTAGCVMDEGSGYLTHSEGKLTPVQENIVRVGMQNYLNQPLTMSGLAASHRHSDGAIVVCGYIAGKGLASLFAGHLYGQVFEPYRVPGKGQDPARIAAVRAYCQQNYINI